MRNPPTAAARVPTQILLPVVKGWGSADLSHPVRVVLRHVAELAMEVDVDLEVEVALVARVGLHLKDAVDLLALLAGDVVLQVEDSLLPVRVRRLGRGREAHALVAVSELDVEEGDKCLNGKVLIEMILPR